MYGLNYRDGLMSQHATVASKQAAIRLASACAMADASTYKMLLPWLEEMMWRGQKSRTQTLAAAGECTPLEHHTCLESVLIMLAKRAGLTHAEGCALHVVGWVLAVHWQVVIARRVRHPCQATMGQPSYFRSVVIWRNPQPRKVLAVMSNAIVI